MPMSHACHITGFGHSGTKNRATRGVADSASRDLSGSGEGKITQRDGQDGDTGSRGDAGEKPGVQQKAVAGPAWRNGDASAISPREAEPNWPSEAGRRCTGALGMKDEDGGQEDEGAGQATENGARASLGENGKEGEASWVLGPVGLSSAAA